MCHKEYRRIHPLISAQNILPPPMSGMQTFMSFFLGNVRPSAQDTVIEVKRTVLAIAWLAINQSVRGVIFLPARPSSSLTIPSWAQRKLHCDLAPNVSGTVRT